MSESATTKQLKILLVAIPFAIVSLLMLDAVLLFGIQSQAVKTLRQQGTMLADGSIAVQPSDYWLLNPVFVLVYIVVMLINVFMGIAHFSAFKKLSRPETVFAEDKPA